MVWFWGYRIDNLAFIWGLKGFSCLGSELYEERGCFWVWETVLCGLADDSAEIFDVGEGRYSGGSDLFDEFVFELDNFSEGLPLISLVKLGFGTDEDCL